MSGNFEKSQGNLEFWEKSGKFTIGQGIFIIWDENFIRKYGTKLFDCHRI